MTAPIEYTYDVFLSYSPEDQSWVNNVLLPELTGAKLKVCKPGDFEIGKPRVINVEQAIAKSRKILLVLTPRWLNSSWNQLDDLLVQSDDPANSLRARLVPLLLEPCQLPARIQMLTPSNFTDQATHEREMDRLLRALKARVFISYKRHAKTDAALAKRIYMQIQQAGYDVFIDRTIKVGQEWARTIEQQIEASDFVIVLLSEASVQSEMLVKEIAHAYWHHLRTSRARLLPIRVNYNAALPYPLSTYLDALQYTEWRPRTKESTRLMISQLLEAIGFGDSLPSSQPGTLSANRQIASKSSPAPYADPRFIASLAVPGGALRPRDSLYVEREADRILRRELSKTRGTTTTIRAPRQTGKSSLLIRGIDQAEKQGSKVLFVDLQAIDNAYLQESDTFLRYFANFVFDGLGLDIGMVERVWKKSIAASNKITELMEDRVLSQIHSKIILAIDEADRILQTPINNVFFGLLRSWHNSRAMNELWDKLDILMVISTEPSLIISDFAQSPFNVASKIELEDFDENQVRELNAGYRSPLPADQISELVDLLNGHPYLTSKALYLLVTEEMSWDQLKHVASTDRSPFSDHLRRQWWMLRDDQALVDALKNIIDHGRCSDDRAFHRLSRAGLITGEDDSTCVFRCKLYEAYFRSRV
jgi:hypothetical protein